MRVSRVLGWLGLSLLFVFHHAGAIMDSFPAQSKTRSTATWTSRVVPLRGGGKGKNEGLPVSVKGRVENKMQATIGSASEVGRRESSRRVSIRWPIFSAFLYFLSMSFTVPVFPKLINQLMNEDQSTKATAASATTYGLLASVDYTFTFLTVNLHAMLSDKFGRRPFMALSTLGLGIGFTITFLSRKVWMLITAAAIDGCTSCMYSIAQACVSDGVTDVARRGEAFGIFQGVAIGMAFMMGIPLGGVLGAKFGIRVPFMVSISLCAFNFLVISLFMPESLQKDSRKKQVDLMQANPLGALKMASRNNLMSGVTACWSLLWFAHAGLQINWINYTDKKLNWGVAQSGATLALLGLLVAIFPKIFIPRLGLERSITYGLFVYTISQVLIASAPGEGTKRASLGLPVMISAIFLTAAGSVAFPAILAYLSHQVGEKEKGAVQGSADTVRTLCTMTGTPFMAWVFASFIKEDAWPKKITGASYYAGAVLATVAWASALLTFRNHGHTNLKPGPGDSGFNFEGMEP